MAILPAAIGIVFNSDHSQVLLVKRQDIPLWVLPGGGVDPGETTEEALLREVHEETGYHVKIIRKCAEYTPVNTLASFTTIYECSIVSGVALKSSETNEIDFFPINQFPKSFLYLHKNWLNENLNSKTLIQRSLKEVNYFTLFKYFLNYPVILLRFAWTRFFKKDL